MKRLALLIICVATIASCTLSDSSNSDNIVLVGLSLSGEVLADDEPLTKNEGSNALLGIQVYQNGSPYAWGLFDSTEGISIYLKTGSNYSITCQYIKNGKSTLKYFDQSTDATTQSYILTDKDTYKKTEGTSSHPVTVTVTYWKKLTSGPYVALYDKQYYNFHRCACGYGAPFNLNDNYWPSTASDSYWCTKYYKKSNVHYEMCSSDLGYLYNGSIPSSRTVCSITNGFVYDNINTINVTSSAVTKSNTSSIDIDRYYGKSGSFTATSGAKTINLNMKHLVYGIQCNVTGVSDGTATINISNGDTSLLSKSGISGEYHSDVKMFAFSDMQGAWQYSNDYTENVTVSMTWKRGVGVLQDLGSQVVQVKRNCINVITVSLSTNSFSMVNDSQLVFAPLLNNGD